MCGIKMHLRKISVVGLGYVGLPMAMEFGLQGKVVAFDINQKRIEELKNGFDRTFEVNAADLLKSELFFTCSGEDLKQADFHIIAVPTPINKAKQPDLSCLLSASQLVGENLKLGDIVVYESTVYPGATEEDCIPVLERFSGLRCGVDFYVGYSPERINPGDREHTFKNIRKVVSGQDQKTLEIIADVYSSVVTAGVHKASSIKVAEAAKVIENTQRDINIALINELATIFEKMDIDTAEVLAAAATKWNFLPFKPGLVGGHCVGVDPYYLTHKANMLGLNPQVILAGRRINDDMGRYIAEQTVKQMIKADKAIKGSTVAVLGLTFKENCNDIRNTRVIDIVEELRSYHINVLIHDPLANSVEVKHEYGVELTEWSDITQVDGLIVAVAHDFYVNLPLAELAAKLKPRRLLIDVKGIFDREALVANDMCFWRL